MKTKSMHKGLAVVLAILMMLALIPVTSLSMKASAAGTTYVLETKDLAKFAAGEKADGDSEKAGTDGYFTLYYSAKSKVDGSAKSFDDGYEAPAPRVNFGGTADPATPKNAIMFKTSNAATVKVWWVSGGEGRNICILDGSGATVDATKVEGLAANSAAPVASLKVPGAGTYFLGSVVNNNYIFKVEVTEEAAAAQDYVLETKDLEKFAAGAKADGASEKAGTDGFFTIYYSAKSKVDGSAKSFDDGYEAPAPRINFGGTADPATPKNAIMFKTTGEATVKVWWVSGGEGRNICILDGSGNTVDATKVEGLAANSAAPVATLKVPAAGTYYLGSVVNNNYIFKVQVTTGGGAAVSRGDWSKVAAPVITSAAQEKDADGKLTDNIVVNVNAAVGNDGGDAVKVVLTDESGKDVASKQSPAESGTHKVVLPVTKSGTYTAKATLVREGETDKTSAAASASFTLTLKTTNISSVTNKGNGSVSVKWDPVDEATGYVVYAGGKEVKASTNSAVVDGLKVGDKVEFTVAAVRGSETGDKSSAVTAAITKESQLEWGFTAYGTSTGKAKNTYTGNLNEGSVTVNATGGAGKLNDTADDGYSFYYTAIPANKNFTFRAKIHVDTWTFSNGQEGFGIAAVDMLPEKSYDTSHWTNVYFVTAGRHGSARQGVGVASKTGITPENWQAVKDNTFDRTKLYGPTVILDNNAPAEGRYNIVGNCTNPDAITAQPATTVAQYVDFDLEITKNNTGYFCSYYRDGKLIGTQKHWGTDVLSKLDKDYVYVGIVAARNAAVTLKNTDYTLTLRDPSQDPAAEPRPLENATPSVVIESDAYANSTSYNLVVRNDYKGTATVKVNGTAAKTVTVGDKYDSDGNIMETIIPVTVKPGSNKIDVTFKLDDAVKAPDGYKFTSREVTVSKTVSYDNYLSTQKNLYVAPNGNKYGNGTKANPLDLKTALTIAAPGQNIILVEGTYKFKETVQSPRGVDGTKDKMIKLIADPDAKTRPVLDFEGNTGIGLQIRGNYWYLGGFDVTHAKSGGIRIDGSNCVVDDIDAYRNYGTGIAIQTDQKFSRLLWPANNLVKNCNAYYNADAGEEDADGFSAKFCVGVGNVFDNCVAYCNADDGWDLYGRNYPIEPVTIQNSVCYKNGYREDGSRGKGNGNGFKLGGDNNAAAHVLINSVSFMNGADGITCNSSPNVIVKNSISYKNDKSGISLYTKASNTNFESSGVISYKNGSADSFQPAGSQDVKKVDQSYWNSANGVSDDWFKSVTFKGSVARNADGSINMEGFLELTDKAPKKAGAVIAKIASDNVTVTADADVPNPRTGFVPFAVVAIVLAGAGIAACVIRRKRRA